MWTNEGGRENGGGSDEDVCDISAAVSFWFNPVWWRLLTGYSYCSPSVRFCSTNEQSLTDMSHCNALCWPGRTWPKAPSKRNPHMCFSPRSHGRSDYGAFNSMQFFTFCTPTPPAGFSSVNSTIFSRRDFLLFHLCDRIWRWALFIPMNMILRNRGSIRYR